MDKKLKKIIFLLGDFLILNIALFLTIVSRYSRNYWEAAWQEHWPSFLPVFIFWLVILYANGFYGKISKLKERYFFSSIINVAIVSSFISTIYFYINIRTDIAPKTNLVLFSFVALLLFYLWRYTAYKLLKSFDSLPNLAIIGWNKRSEKLLAELEKLSTASYKNALIFKDLEEIASLPEKITEKNVRSIIICDDFGDKESLGAALFSCLPANVDFYNYADFYELLSEKIPIEAIGPDWFLTNVRKQKKIYYSLIKRVLDFLLAAITAIIFLPFGLIIAIIIKLNSRGPVFFRQKRLGEKEKEFEIIKFRTMKVENNDYSPTKEKDPRITAFGSFLRKTHLDEVPQLWNIIKGEMSFIGPRPERPELIESLEKEIPFYKTRLLIKPGLTGWDQISGIYHSATIEDTFEKLQYDLYYLKNRSLLFDIMILIRTLATIISREGR